MKHTVTKKELAYRIAESTNMNAVIVAIIVQRILDIISEALAQGERVELRNFGIFTPKIKIRTKFTHPQTHEQIFQPQEKIAHFKAGAIMANMVLEKKEN